MNQRTKTAQIYLQKDLEGTVSKGASTAVGLDELGPNSLSPQVDHRRKKVAYSPRPQKPKRDGAKRSVLKMPKKCRTAQQRLPIPPEDTNGEKPMDQDASASARIDQDITVINKDPSDIEICIQKERSSLGSCRTLKQRMEHMITPL
ncbi:hypothetical protein Ancab_028359 [Ancistrocladus abbreviatus]